MDAGTQAQTATALWGSSEHGRKVKGKKGWDNSGPLEVNCDSERAVHILLWRWTEQCGAVLCVDGITV